MCEEMIKEEPPEDIPRMMDVQIKQEHFEEEENGNRELEHNNEIDVKKEHFEEKCYSNHERQLDNGFKGSTGNSLFLDNAGRQLQFQNVGENLLTEGKPYQCSDCCNTAIWCNDYKKSPDMNNYQKMKKCHWCVPQIKKMSKLKENMTYYAGKKFPQSILSKQQKVGVALATLLVCIDEKPKKRKKRFWANKWLQDRSQFTHAKLLRELNSTDFRIILRMDEDCFVELLRMVKPIIKKNNTVMRESVSAEERLIATLRYLASGRSFEDLKFSAGISAQLLSSIIPETCGAIYKCLKKYIKIHMYPIFTDNDLIKMTEENP